MSNASNQQVLKVLVAQAAVERLPDQPFFLGVGTGSTVDLFIDALAASSKPLVAAVSSSARTSERLRAKGLGVMPVSELESPLALYVDGADEVEPGLALTKGGGGALTQEKIVASAARRFICIVDESKLVDRLGAFPIPLEVIESAIAPIEWAIKARFPEAQIARRADLRTDNGHPILDITGLRIDDPAESEDWFNGLPGVVCCGIFFKHRAHEVLVATAGGVRVMSRNDRNGQNAPS